MKRFFIGYFVALVLAVSSRADFPPYYSFPVNPVSGLFWYYANHRPPTTVAINNWFISDANNGWSPQSGAADPQVQATNSSLSLFTGTPLHFPNALTSTTVQVATIAPAAGFWNFDFVLTLSTAPQSSEGSRGGYYFVNGTNFNLPEGSGSVTNVHLNFGDSFGFVVYDSVYVSHVAVNARLDVTNFSAPVPEPSTVGLLVLGTIVLGWSYRIHASNQAMQRTAGRAAFPLAMTSTFNQQPRSSSPAVADLLTR